MRENNCEEFSYLLNAGARGYLQYKQLQALQSLHTDIRMLTQLGFFYSARVIDRNFHSALPGFFLSSRQTPFLSRQTASLLIISLSQGPPWTRIYCTWSLYLRFVKIYLRIINLVFKKFIFTQ